MENTEVLTVSEASATELKRMVSNNNNLDKHYHIT